MKKLLPFLFLLWCFSGQLFAFQTQQDTTQSFFESLLREDAIELTLESDFKHLVSHKKDKVYQPARLSFVDQNSTPQSWEVEVRTRGQRRLEICDNPQLKIRFSEEEMRQRGFKPGYSMKLVIPCENAAVYEQYLLREYLAYRLYNLFTEKSFRVQLARVRFIDANGDSAMPSNFALLLEDKDEVAARNGGKVLPNVIKTSRLLNHDETEVFCLFQFMIGNTDWYVFNKHNVKLFGVPGDLPVKPIPIPYDFDYSGLVNAPYATPVDQVPTEHVTQRWYQGYCRRPEETLKTVQIFLAKEEEVMRLCAEFPYFNKRSRKYALGYIKRFYKIVKNKKKVKKQVLRHCDKWLKPLR